MIAVDTAKLMNILTNMDLPKGRLDLTQSNIRWLLRNIQINNGNHPDIIVAIELLKNLLTD